MAAFSHFERYMLSQPCPSLRLPALRDDASESELAERAEILLYGSCVPRGEENLRGLCIAVGILPASPEEVRQYELAGY